MKDNMIAAIRRELIRQHENKTYPEIAYTINSPGVTKDVIRHICRGDNAADDKYEAIWYSIFDGTSDDITVEEPLETEGDKHKTNISNHNEEQLVFEDLAPMKNHSMVAITDEASDCIEYIKIHTDMKYKDIASMLIIYASKHITWKQQGAANGAE